MASQLSLALARIRYYLLKFCVSLTELTNHSLALGEIHLFQEIWGPILVF